MKYSYKNILAILSVISILGLSTSAVHAAKGDALAGVLERGSLLCPGHNGSFLGFAEVDDKGAWKGVDIDMCRALAAGLFGSYENHLEIVPTSWAQRWPALQSGDIDVVIKVSGWTQSRDTELNLAYSRPYFIGAFQVMAHKELGAETLSDMAGGSICVSSGTSTERVLAAYIESNNIDVEVVKYEKGDEVRTSYLNGRCDGIVEWAPSLAAMRVSVENPTAHVILPDVLDLEAEGIIVQEGDANWLDIQNWMLSSLWFAEQENITSANVDAVRANPSSTTIGKFLGVTPGYGKRLGLSDDWAYNMIKSVGNFAEIYDRNIGSGSPYNLPRGINSLYSDGGVFYPMIID